MCEDESGNDVTEEIAESPLLICALHQFGTAERLLALPIMAPHLSWTRHMLYALRNFARWQLAEAQGVSCCVSF